MSEEGLEYLFKVMVVGHSNAGKTSIIQRYTKDNFSADYKTTIGVDFFMKKIIWNEDADILLQLWDLGGQDRFTNLSRAYYQQAVGAIVVFDCTSEASLLHSKEWKADIDAKVTWNGKKIPTVLFANKIDLGAGSFMKDREIIEECCRECGFIGWFETSAKDNKGIDGGMMFLISKIMELGGHAAQGEAAPTNDSTITIRPRPKKVEADNKPCC
uniref:Ras-related protein Rab n=1 Tax=Vannella robusta TaxID=1487602 RepID=A0A7S4HNL6_9EUKA